MIYGRNMIFMFLSLLFVPLVYSVSSTPYACAVPPDPKWDPNGTCGATTRNPKTGDLSKTCCWTEMVPGKLPSFNTQNVCQTCYIEESTLDKECTTPEVQRIGGLEQPPTPSPTPAPEDDRPLTGRLSERSTSGDLHEPEEEDEPEDNREEESSNEDGGQDTAGPLT
jgi:hypothetical protein